MEANYVKVIIAIVVDYVWEVVDFIDVDGQDLIEINVDLVDEVVEEVAIIIIIQEELLVVNVINLMKDF